PFRNGFTALAAFVALALLAFGLAEEAKQFVHRFLGGVEIGRGRHLNDGRANFFAQPYECIFKLFQQRGPCPRRRCCECEKPNRGRYTNRGERHTVPPLLSTGGLLSNGGRARMTCLSRSRNASCKSV